MTTVEGGMVCTNDERLYHHAILKRSHGLARELPAAHHAQHARAHPAVDFNFLFLTDGFNVRNTELHAVLGISQLKRLDHYIAIRSRNHKQFLKILEPYERFFHIPNNPGMSSFCLPFILKDEAMKHDLERMLRYAGIESRPIISGNLLRQPFLKRRANHHRFKNAEYLHTHGFYIGNNQFVGLERLRMLQEILESFFEDRMGRSTMKKRA